MSRPLRIEFAGALYHVQARGNAGRPIFLDDSDRHRFLEVLEAVASRYHLVCYAYCLMNETYDLLVETPEANISRAMRQLNGVYGLYFRRRHGRKGHVFRGRFRARLLEKEPYLPEVSRQVALRPVRSGLVAHPSDWPWSSYRAAVGEAPAPGFLACGWFGDPEGDSVAEARRAYRAFVASGLAGEDPLLPLEKRPILGSAAFDESLRPCLRDRTRSHPAVPGGKPSEKPPLHDLLSESCGREIRNARIREAYLRHGYTMKEIGEELQLHYSTVSRIVAGNGRG
jgi:putative transposase